MKKLILFIIALTFCHSGSAQRIELISRAMDGYAAGNSYSRNIDISDDGRFIVFSSGSPDIVENDTNLYHFMCHGFFQIPAFDIFRYDQTTREIQRISLDENHNELIHRDSKTFSMSTDGQQVVFLSIMYDGLEWDAHIYDTDKSYRLFPEVNLYHDRFTICGNGKFIAYYYIKDIYVYNVETKDTELVTANQDGEKSYQAPKHYPAMSHDGRNISYISYATDVTTEATGGLFIRDRSTNEDKIVFPLNGHSTSNLQFTRDAKNLFFSTTAPLVSSLKKPSGIFTYNLLTEKINPISLPDYNGVTFENIDNFSINSSGRYIVFNNDFNLFRYDLQTQKLLHLLKIDTLLNTKYVDLCGYDHTIEQEYLGEINISADGKFVVFTTNADLLVPEDTNSRFDAYLLEVEEESTAGNWQVFE